MRRIGLFFFALIAASGTLSPASAADCNGKKDALGVSRVIAVDPREHTRVGTMQYPETLPLADHEVVLTFDDGPSPRYTDRILETLSSECVKATFFMVGLMAKNFPDIVKHVQAEGHTIGTHSFHHPFTFRTMTEEQAGAEIDQGIDAVGTALGDPSELAPFFRVPGFLTSESAEAATASRGLMMWSADFPADDWKGISSAEIIRRAMSRLEAKGRGILLLHDIHGQTAEALPVLLSQLKLKGYKIVQVVPASESVPKTETTPDQWKIPHQEHSTELTAEKQVSPAANVADASKKETSKARYPNAIKRALAVSRKAMASHRMRIAHGRKRAHSSTRRRSSKSSAA